MFWGLISGKQLGFNFELEQWCLKVFNWTTKVSSANLQNCLPPVFDTLGGSLWVLSVWMGKKNPGHDWSCSIFPCPRLKEIIFFVTTLWSIGCFSCVLILVFFRTTGSWLEVRDLLALMVFFWKVSFERMLEERLFCWPFKIILTFTLLLWWWNEPCFITSGYDYGMVPKICRNAREEKNLDYTSIYIIQKWTEFHGTKWKQLCSPWGFPLLNIKGIL